MNLPQTLDVGDGVQIPLLAASEEIIWHLWALEVQP